MKNCEYYTSLRNGEVVRKDHPEIVFRGVLDSVMADVICGQALAYDLHRYDLLAHLRSVYEILDKIMIAHALGEDVDGIALMGHDRDQLRDISHSFGLSTVTYSDGPLQPWLNVIRTHVRDAERAFIACYPDEDDIPQGIAAALNAVSSAVHILMCREVV